MNWNCEYPAVFAPSLLILSPDIRYWLSLTLQCASCRDLRLSADRVFPLCHWRDEKLRRLLREYRKLLCEAVRPAGWVLTTAPLSIPLIFPSSQLSLFHSLTHARFRSPSLCMCMFVFASLHFCVCISFFRARFYFFLRVTISHWLYTLISIQYVLCNHTINGSAKSLNQIVYNLSTRRYIKLSRHMPV